MVRITLPAGLTLPNANQRVHYMVKYRQKKDVREAAWAVAKSLRLAPIERAAITAAIHPDVLTPRFDPHNWGDAVKAAIDGIAAAGVLRDDSSRHLRAVTFVDGPPVAGWQLELIITSLLASPSPGATSTSPPRPAARQRRNPPRATA